MPTQRIWPLLLLILAAVLVPTACVLWLMNAAMSNERLAVRERLVQFYQARLNEASRHVDDYWESKRDAFNLRPGESPGEAFARLAATGEADSFTILDEHGRLAYPNAAAAAPDARAPPTSPAHVWGLGVFVTARSVDRCVNTLRTKIEPEPAQPQYIHTVRPVGYRFNMET